MSLWRTESAIILRDGSIGPCEANLVLIANASSEGSGEPAHPSRGTFRGKARSLAPLNGWACAVKVCHDGMLEDTKSLDGAQLMFYFPGQRGAS